MKHIFAIGGGELVELETLAIDKKIVKACGKSNPRALFIPTASGEPSGYVDGFKTVYGDCLGCLVDTLYLLDGKTSIQEAKEKIDQADIIYVGGGNTKKMMEVWKEYEVDKVLKEAAERGAILAGLSAGSICWFESGHSDSLSFEAENEWSYIRVKGLGLLSGMHCPHFNEGNREDDFVEKLGQTGEVGIAIENNCAIEFKGNDYKILKSDSSAKAYKITNRNGHVEKTELFNENDFLPYVGGVVDEL